MRRPAGLSHRFIQYSGRLYTSSIVLSELYAGAFLLPDPEKRLSEIRELLTAIRIINFGPEEAETFGQIRGELGPKGKTINPLDLQIGATARTHNFTIVTHNVKHFEAIPGLRIEDWLSP
jgi:tRNA(fMet)-specific endonuclease VapC